MQLFLLGAGFDADAAGEAGPIYGNSIYVGSYRIDCSYPTLADVAGLCFGLDNVLVDKSIEEMFADAIEQGNYDPLRKLYERIMEADFRLAWRLSSPEHPSCYREFFESFSESTFITFNYDSLPAIFLHRLHRWYPHDGYGVPVETETMAGAMIVEFPKSTSLVLHLHGSFCVYTMENEIIDGAPGAISWLQPLATPRYLFDPDSISMCFPLYRRSMSRTGYISIEERVIAPVPGKATQLQAPFIMTTYERACLLIRESGNLIAIGYSFNRHDGASYGPLLEALSSSPDKSLVIVSPQATEAAEQITHEYRALRVKSIDKTFNTWAQDSFRY